MARSRRPGPIKARLIGRRAHLVFVTAFDHHAVEAFATIDEFGYAVPMSAHPPRLYVWLTSVLALGAIPAMASAYCVGWDKSLPNYDPAYYSVSHEFKRAKYIVTAKVIGETWIGEDGKPKPLQPPFQNGSPKPWGFDPYAGTYYDLRVEGSFRGKAPSTLRLFSENSTARFWFDVGSEWVIFVTDDTFDQPIGSSLTMDTCGNSKPLPKARALLGALQRLGKAAD